MRWSWRSACLAAGGGLDPGAGLDSLLKDAAPEPQTGMWWNPAESGRGYAVERQGSVVTLGAYMYEAGGQPVWYVGLLNRQASGSYQGQISRYAGGQTLTGSYRAPTSGSTVATATFTLSSATSGTLTFVTATATQAVAVQRLALTADGVAASGASFESGLWWNEAESGRGFFLDVQANTVAMASYMYDGTGQPVWYLTAAQFTGQTFSGTMLSYLNGQTLGGAYRAPTGAGSSGTLSFRALSTTTAEITLPGGRVVPVRRLSFAPPETARLEGVYEGAVTSARETEYLTMLALDNGELWLAAGSGTTSFGTPVGMALVNGAAAGGNYASTALWDFGDGQQLQTGALTATYTAGGTVNGTIRLNGQSGTYSFALSALPVARYDPNPSPSLSAIAGNWPFQSSLGLSGTVSISASGAVSGAISGCPFSGTLAPRSGGKNLFTASIAATGGAVSGPSCPSGTGYAWAATGPSGASQLWIAYADAARSQGMVLLGQR